MTRASRRVTLVELLVAMALALIVVGLVAGIATQVNRTVGVTTVREEAARVARVMLNDIERDLQHMLPVAVPPAPFADPVLRLENPDAAADGSRDPSVPPRDRLVLLTTIRDPDGGGGTVRAYVTYELGDGRAMPGGGPVAAPLLRRVRLGGETPGGRQPSLLEANVVSLELEWLDGAGVFQDPSPATASGDSFGAVGQVEVVVTAGGETALKGSDAPGKALLTAVPVGDELLLRGPGLAGTERVLVRKRPTGVDLSDLAIGEGPVVLVADRLDPASGITATTFRPPPMIRATLVLAFGKGPDQGTATFSRSFVVPK